jgi:high-affinity iron transporter
MKKLNNNSILKLNVKIFRPILACLLYIFIAFNAQAMNPSEIDMQSIVKEIIIKADDTVQNYTKDKSIVTGQFFSRLYFDDFETKGMEFALTIYNRDAALDLEIQFSSVMNLAMQGKPKTEVIAAWQTLRSNLLLTAEKYQDKHSSGFWSLFWQSFLILLREGFEAILVVTALITYLRRAGAGDKVKTIWIGVGCALLASVAMAWSIRHFTQSLSGASQEAMEGFIMLLAAIVLFYVSYWLFSKRDTARWQSFIKDKIDKAISTGGLFMLGFAAFLAVFREGAETILFYEALLVGTSNNTNAVILGFILAGVALIGVYFALRSASVKLPLKLFFSLTALFLFIMAFIFTGKGILELQVSGLISMTSLSGFPQISTLGIFPSIESLSAQLLLLILGGLSIFTKNKFK